MYVICINRTATPSGSQRTPPACPKGPPLQRLYPNLDVAKSSVFGAFPHPNCLYAAHDQSFWPNSVLILLLIYSLAQIARPDIVTCMSDVSIEAVKTSKRQRLSYNWSGDWKMPVLTARTNPLPPRRELQWALTDLQNDWWDIQQESCPQ